MAAYVASLGRAPASPYRDGSGNLTAAALRGRDLFYRPDTRCSTCHVPPAFTLSSLPPAPEAFALFDVGTLVPGRGGRLGGPLPGLDVPTLLGLWDGEPWLHAGQARTLREVLTTHDPADRHGVTSQLTPAEIDDLERLLLEIDDGSDVLPAALPPAVPGEVSAPGAGLPLLAVRRGAGIELHWGFEPRATGHRVVRGELSSRGSHTADAGRGAGACDAGPGRTWTDPDDLADPQSFYYLVAGVSPAGEGTYGSLGPRLPSGDCP